MHAKADMKPQRYICTSYLNETQKLELKLHLHRPGRGIGQKAGLSLRLPTDPRRFLRRLGSHLRSLQYKDTALPMGHAGQSYLQT